MDPRSKLPYEHMTNYVVKDRNYKDEDGKVKIEPRSFVTGPPKKGNPATTPGVLFQEAHYEHMPDPYDNGKMLARKEIEDHNKKLQDGKAWKPMVGQSEPFNDIEKTYGTELKFKEKKPAPKPKPQVQHDRPFRPSNPVKKGKSGAETFEIFPEWNPEKQFTQKKKQPKVDNEKGSWKPTYNKQTRPTPSVTTFNKNIRSEFGSMLGRRF